MTRTNGIRSRAPQLPCQCQRTTHILNVSAQHTSSSLSHHCMAPPPKRSRVVSSLDAPSPSLFSGQLRTTCTNNNARRLAQAHTVTLRSTRNRDNRQHQKSAHTTVQQSTELLDKDWEDVNEEDEDDNNVKLQEEGNSEVPDSPDKRPPVRLTHVYQNKFSYNHLRSLDPVKTGCLIVENISMRCTVTMAWECLTSH